LPQVCTDPRQVEALESVEDGVVLHVRHRGDVRERPQAVLEDLAVEEGEALPALWEGCTDEELLGILASFRGSRSDAENLASLLAQLATLNPPGIERMVSAGLGPVPASDVSELLATVLDPRQLGALRHATAAPSRG
jgi:hypothetical protein